MVAYLASDKTAFITGTNLAVNGGQHMFWRDMPGELSWTRLLARPGKIEEVGRK
jgi:hypothetical protein